MQLAQISLAFSLTLLLGCRSDKDETEPDEDTAAWWEIDVEDSADDSGDKPDDDGDKPDDDGDKPDDDGDKPDDDGDKPDDSEIEDCPDDFDSTEPCEGDWKTTMCMHDDLLWWCEDGVWLNEDDKE